MWTAPDAAKRPGSPPAAFVPNTVCGDRVPEARRQEIGQQDAVDRVPELRRLGRVSHLDQEFDPALVRFGELPAISRFPHGSASISSVSWLAVNDHPCPYSTSANGCPFLSRCTPAAPFTSATMITGQ